MLFLFFIIIIICIFTEVELIYNVVLISAVEQSDSVIHKYIPLFILFSIMLYHRIVKRIIVLCAIG